MALKFVTAKAGAAHISSADWKSLNRGIMGRGKYILIDTENNSQNGYIVSPAQGEVSIPPCSLMWSGAHIRNTTTTVLKYTPPTVDSTINVWLHYLKNADSGVETLEFVLTVNEQPTPVIDEIEDNALEAYTLFCYFTHKVGSTEEEYYNRDFEPVASLVGTHERTDQRLEALDDKLDDEIEKRQSDISTHSTRLDNLDEDMRTVKPIVLNRVNVLYETVGTEGLSSALTINEPVTNYSLLCFEIRKKGSINNLRGNIIVNVPVNFEKYNKYVNVTYQKVSKGTLSTDVEDYSGKISIDATLSSQFKISVDGDLSGETLKITGIR